MTIRKSTKDKINQKISEYSNVNIIYGGLLSNFLNTITSLINHESLLTIQ